MDRSFAERAKITGGLDQADAEMPLPEPVDGHAREQGVLGVQHPFHELLAAAGRKALSCAGAGRHVEPCVGDVKHAADFFLGSSGSPVSRTKLFFLASSSSSRMVQKF